MNDHRPSLLAENIPLEQSKVWFAARGRRLGAGVLAVAWLWISAGAALGQTTRTDYLDADLGDKLEDLGRLYEDTTQGLKSGARQVLEVGPSGRPVPVLTEIIRITQVFSAQPLQPTGNPNTSGGGTNISRDGACVVGYQDSGDFTPFHAFRWTQATGPVDLGTLDSAKNTSRSSLATDTNQDCSVVVGDSEIAGGLTGHAFRWTSAGMVDLGVPANGGPISRALGVSSNGTVVVGDADFPDPNNLISGKSRKAFRWTQAGGFQNLGDLQPTGLAIATAVTGDGTVVVGQATVSNGSRAFRWITPTPPAQPVMQPIGPLPGHTHAAAIAVSDNGKIIAGISHPTFLQYQGVVLGWNQGTAFRWTQATGIQDLRQVLSDNGIDMTGITLVTVTGMSPDGQWIQGKATNAQTGPNETVAFVAQVCDDDIGGPCSTNGTAPFTLGASPTQLNVSAGQSTSTTITLTPNAGFTQPVSFSCGGLPVGAACSFNPASVTPAGGPMNTTLTITTDGGSVAELSPGRLSTMFAYALTPFALLMTGVLLYRRRVDDHSLWTGLLLIFVVAMASCSSSDSSTPPVNSGGGVPATGTPAGTSNVTVTASSGGSSSGVPIQLTVTRP